MPIPNVSITKAAFGAGGAAPSILGILAIIASSATGTQNQASGYYRDDLAYNAFSDGPLVQYASYDLQQSGNPVVLIRPTTAQPGIYTAITSNPGTGTSAVTTDGVVLPQDKYNVLITVQQGGTIGQTGITYTYSLDGFSTSAVQQLGTNTSITLPNGAGKVNFGAGTLASGATYQFFTDRPMPTNVDLPAALAALKATRMPWEGVLIDCQYNVGTVGLIDTWLTGLEQQGSFHWAVINTRMKNRPVPATETEAAYQIAMQNLTQNDATIRMIVGTDGADYTSTMHGWSQERETSMFVAARAMAIPVGTDPAYTSLGNIPGAGVTDQNSNPRHHDEDLFPGLDALRLTSLRMFAPGQNSPQGVYICNANVLSPSGSSYVWLQHIRTMNVACSIAWGLLATQLSKGVSKKQPDPVTKGVYIAEEDAQSIEGLVNPQIQSALLKQVAAALFTLSRTDDFSNNANAVCNGTVQLVSLAYLKQFKVTTTFTKAIAVPANS